MTDKSSLPGDWRIARSSALRSKRRLLGPWIGGGVALVAADVRVLPVTAGEVDVPIRVAIASTRILGGSVARTSLLKVSRYVVARCAATVSSKITGHVVAVLLEEGQQVIEKDQVITQLDGTNIRAVLQHALTQSRTAVLSLKSTQVVYGDSKTAHDCNSQLFPKGWTRQIDFEKCQASYHAAKSALELAARVGKVAATVLVAQRAVYDAVLRAGSVSLR